jgi:hypothetical protein
LSKTLLAQRGTSSSWAGKAWGIISRVIVGTQASQCAPIGPLMSAALQKWVRKYWENAEGRDGKENEFKALWGARPLQRLAHTTPALLSSQAAALRLITMSGGIGLSRAPLQCICGDKLTVEHLIFQCNLLTHPVAVTLREKGDMHQRILAKCTMK